MDNTGVYIRSEIVMYQN